MAPVIGGAPPPVQSKVVDPSLPLILPRFVAATVGTAAHEWVHHYLAFYPLGASYFRSQDLRTLNETVADVVGDEVAVARCDLDMCKNYKDTLFDFERYRMPEYYKRITEQRGATEPDA